MSGDNESSEKQDKSNNKNIKNYLLSIKHFDLLNKANSSRCDTAKKLSNEIGLSTDHLVYVMKDWEKIGLINKNKEGVENKLSVTQKGRSVIGVIEDLILLLNKK